MLKFQEGNDLNNRLTALILTLAMLLMLAACGNTEGTSDSENPSNAMTNTSVNEQDFSDSLDQPIAGTSNIELSYTYATRFEEVNFVTYPTFYFDYPDGWTVTSEEVTPTTEKVVLTNGRGATVTYWNFGTMRDLTGPTRDINCVNVTRVADASFVPSEVQATDYSDLGAFMVAKLTVTGGYDMDNGGEYVEMPDGRVRYALLPESEEGEQEECLMVGLPTFSFWYAGHISLIANAPDGKFTEQEEKEVIAILSSFRDIATPSETEDLSPNSAGENAATTIDELWEMLEGTWNFEEYTFKGEITHAEDHTMEFRYVDNKPCMCKDLHSDTSYVRDVIFYDFSVVDEFHYNAYTYKRNSYGGEGDNWSEDVQLVWWSFDLSNLSNGELSMTYNKATDNGFVDNSNTFKYSLN